MTKVHLAVLLAIGMSSGGIALAEHHTASIGYAQSRIEDFKHIRGTNLQYRYEDDTALSFLSSFSYMHRSGDSESFFPGKSADVKAQYYSLLAGPAYRINDNISLYALGGVARTKIDADGKMNNGITGFSSSGKSTSFACGLGVIINPVENISVNLGYESAKTNLNGNRGINGFNIGAGYRF